MLVSASPRAAQQILLRSCGAVTGSAVVRGVLLKSTATSPNCVSTSALSRQVASRLFYSSCARPSVIPSVRQRRPTIRGEAVAFHVKDLENIKQNRTRLSHQGTAAALQPDYDDDYLDDYEDRHLGQARQYESDLIVVLDMDECLIHSQFLTNNPGAKFYAHQVARNSKDEHGEPVGRVDSFRFNLPDGDLVQVNKRPFLEEFLQAVTSKYETHIYTAAMKVYAEPILDILDPHGDRFARRWYRESCDLDKNMGAYVKNLSSLPLNPKGNTKQGLTYDEYINRSLNNQNGNLSSSDAHSHLRRVVLVDNNPLSFLANPTNGILVSSFYNDPADKTLPAVLDLLKELDPLEDVRPTLDARFGLKAALSEIQGNRRQQQKKQWTSK